MTHYVVNWTALEGKPAYIVTAFAMLYRLIIILHIKQQIAVSYIHLISFDMVYFFMLSRKLVSNWISIYQDDMRILHQRHAWTFIEM